jgi:hypothetical protein
MPVVINGIALCPSLVFNTPGAGGFGTGAASALDENAKQASADRMRHTGVTFLNCSMSVFMCFFRCLSPLVVLLIAGPEEAQNLAGKDIRRPIQIRLITSSLEKMPPTRQGQSGHKHESQIRVPKHGQLFIGAHTFLRSHYAIELTANSCIALAVPRTQSVFHHRAR